MKICYITIHHNFSYRCLLHRSCVHITIKAVLTLWSIPIGVLLHLGTYEDTLHSHMYRNLNQCRFEGVGFTNTPTSKHLINYQIPIRRLTKLKLQHLAILNYYIPYITFLQTFKLTNLCSHAQFSVFLTFFCRHYFN